MDLPTDLGLPTDLVLPVDPVYRLPECHHKKFIEKLRNAEIKIWRDMDQWEKSKSKPINQLKEDEDLETKPHNKHMICSNAQTFPDGPKSMEYYSSRCARSHDTDYFKKGYKFVEGIRSCITSNSLCCIRSEKCFDSVWIAVHGLESICMVTWQDMDMTSLPAYYVSFRAKEEAMPDFAKAVISEVECIPYDDHDYEDTFCRALGGTVKRPFCVVSKVLDDTKRVREKTGYVDLSMVYDVNKAINFLEDKMRSDLSFTDEYETIQTAIGAFQHMCRCQKLRAKDIWVTTFHFLSGFEHLHIDQRREQLDILNGRSSAKAPLKWPLFRHRILSPESDDKSSLPASCNKHRLRSLPESLDKCVFHTL